MGYHVPISLQPLLQDPPFAVVLFWLGTAIGYRLLRVFRAPLEQVSALEHGALSVVLGLGCLQYLPFVLGLAGVLTPKALFAGLLLLLVAFAYDMFRVAYGAGIALFRNGPIMLRPEARWRLVGGLLLCVPLVIAMLKALTPPTDPDGIGYHLVAAKRWLQAGRLCYLPTLIHTNGPMGVEMLYTLALGAWSDTAAKLIHYGYGVVALITTFALGRRFRGANVGFAAAALWLLGPHASAILPGAAAPPSGRTLQQFSWTYVELASTAQILCTILAWLLWRRERHVAWLFTAVLCAGFAMTTKLTNGFLGVALALLVMGTLLERHEPWRVVLARGIAVAALAILPVLPWLWRSWMLTGNPVYPAFSSMFRTRDWSAETDRAFNLYFKYYNWGEMVSRWLNLPNRMALCYVAEAIIILMAVLIASRWKDPEARLMTVATAILALFTVQTTGLYLRFFLPLVPLVYLLICMAAAKPLAQNLYVRLLLLLFLLFGVVKSVRDEAPTLPGDAAVAMGSLNRADYLRDRLPGLYDIWEFANQNLEPDAHILVGPLVSYAHGGTYYCDRFCLVTDAHLQFHIRMDTWEHFLSDVERDRIAYVLVQTPASYKHAGPNYLPAKNEEPFMNYLAHTYGTALFTSDCFTLYRIGAGLRGTTRYAHNPQPSFPPLRTKPPTSKRRRLCVSSSFPTEPHRTVLIHQAATRLS